MVLTDSNLDFISTDGHIEYEQEIIINFRIKNNILETLRMISLMLVLLLNVRRLNEVYIQEPKEVDYKVIESYNENVAPVLKKN